MKRLLLVLISFTTLLTSYAQRINRNYHNRSMSEVLIDLNKATNRYKISFIYDELEDFNVNKAIHSADVPMAINAAIGFYPIAMNVGDSLITVECIHKEQRRLIGRLLDNANQPVMFANIQLLNTKDSSFVTGGVTNENGDFVIPCQEDRIIAKFTCVGYKTLYRELTPHRIGNVHMSPALHYVNGVVVKGHQPQYKMGAEGLATNVENTTLSQLGVAEDVLKHVPMVTQKGDGSFYVFGKGTPVIYINGREMRDETVLTQLKSTDIKNIEVITNPGAQYDASAKAIIKIKTKPRAGEGWGFDVQSKYEQSRYANLDEQLAWSYRKNKFDLFGSFRYRHMDWYDDKVATQEVHVDTLWKEQNLLHQHTTANHLYVPLA